MDEWAAPPNPGERPGPAAAPVPVPPAVLAQPRSGTRPPSVGPVAGGSQRLTDGVSVAALVTGIVGLVPVAVVLGMLGIRRTGDGTRGGRGLAVAGLVLAGAWTVLAIVVLAVLAFLVTGLAVTTSCTGERCDVTVRGEQLTEVSGHDLAVTDIGSGGATVTVDGDPVQLAVGETRQVARSLVQLTSVDGEVVRLTLDFGGEYLSRGEVESRVGVDLGVDRQQVTCPRDLAAVEGNTMTCDVTAGPGTWSEARVTVTAVEGEQVDTTVEGSRRP